MDHAAEAEADVSFKLIRAMYLVAEETGSGTYGILRLR